MKAYTCFERRLQEVKARDPDCYESLLMELEMWAGAYGFNNLKEAVEFQVSFRTRFNHRTPREMTDLIFSNRDPELFMRSLLTG